MFAKSAPLVLLLLALCALPPTIQARHLRQAAPGEEELWSVVVDAGSTGSRVAVFKFVAPQGFTDVSQVDLDLFDGTSVKPGLSSYAGKPDEAAASLQPLIDKALATVPAEKQASTRIQLGATAGLRFLGEAESEAILAAVRTYLREKTPFKVDDADARILSGEEEGVYGWVQANYVLGHLGLPANQTLAVIDMGGGSMQETFAMTPEQAAARPPNSTEIVLGNGNSTLPDYLLYTHSYLGFGSKAARAAVLAEGTADGSADSPCIPEGADTNFTYNGKTFQVMPMPGGASPASCATAVLKAIKTFAPCGAVDQSDCTFQGVWGGGTTPEDVILLSSFWYTALEGGLVPANATAAQLTPRDYENLAAQACSMTLEELAAAYPSVPPANLPYLCLDASTIYVLLTEGFKFAQDQPLELLQTVSYDRPSGTVEEAQDVAMSWTLGAALTTLLGWTGEYLQ
ncbi:GDA1 CD39 nucleoside phosphatase family [Chlorella sorokiniana]|uniref:GDA1 CD39 nucleoside phosphatase family n=1 Tax=Chlorella sorokiniana TaxID=3076 RepID=A0A2P6TK85_CHLSO|nr:GDA1 CD39 nucleoside phosphatase family [Chlorella sorokiniana]|eukprot:PRW44502.1 GDA1 CD39 nucleoside phosphatase family [Chlorella sorokiniana]